MNFLEKLTPDHRQLITRLPYRIGLWVSHSDTSGGAEADERERQALSNILHAVTEDMFGAEAIQYIMSETIRNKAEWPKWGMNIDMVPSECRDAIDLMRQYADSKDAKAFKNHLMEIAEAVALAFREEDSGTSIITAFSMYISHIFSGPKRKRSFSDFQNISASERKALETIADALEAA